MGRTIPNDDTPETDESTTQNGTTLAKTKKKNVPEDKHTAEINEAFWNLYNLRNNAWDEHLIQHFTETSSSTKASFVSLGDDYLEFGYDHKNSLVFGVEQEKMLWFRNALSRAEAHYRVNITEQKVKKELTDEEAEQLDLDVQSWKIVTNDFDEYDRELDGDLYGDERKSSDILFSLQEWLVELEGVAAIESYILQNEGSISLLDPTDFKTLVTDIKKERAYLTYPLIKKLVQREEFKDIASLLR